MTFIKRSNQIFPNGANFLINGGNFISAQKVSYHKTSSPADLLYQHIASGALLDSSERFDPPRCDHDTRVVILQTIMDWITGGNKMPSILWLHGPAGAGKSALAQTIAEKCKELGILGAVFFFSRNASTSDRSDGGLLITTLVHQIIAHFPIIRPYIQNYINRDGSIFNRSIEAQAENLLVSPINKVTGSFRYFLARLFLRSELPRLFLVDGLDECSDIKIQCEILEVLAKAARDLKLPFRILIASRPESHIRSRFDHSQSLKDVSVRQLDLAQDVNAENDIRVYVTSEFKKIVDTHPLREYIPASWPSQAAIETLVYRSSGQFIYASTVIKYIQSTKHRPTNRLEFILGLFPTPANDTPYATLDALYTHIFSSVEDPARVMQIFSLLAIPRKTDDGLGTFNTPNMIDQLLFFEPGDTLLILTDLQSIVAFDDRNSPIKHHHASLNDFLLDSSRSRHLHVDLPKAHEQLARGYLRLLMEDIQLNGAAHAKHSLPTPVINNGEAAYFDSLFVAFIRNYTRAGTISDELGNDLENMDLLGIYRHMFSKTSSEIPQYFKDRLNTMTDAIVLKSFWQIRNLWKSRAMEQLLRPFTRNDLPNQDRILRSHMSVLQNTYGPRRELREPLASLLSQPRFKDYVFRVCDHTQHDSCEACQKISPLASILSYQLMHAHILNQSSYAYHWDEGSDKLLFGETCTEQAYFCLTFVDAIAQSITDSHGQYGTQEGSAHGVLSARETIKRRTQYNSYADSYFEAALDCAILVLPYSEFETSLTGLLAKFLANDPWDHDYVLRRFSPRFEELKLQIEAYNRRIDYFTESRTLVGT